MSEPRRGPRERGNESAMAKARIAAGMTQSQLAEAIGCLQREVSSWERGERIPRFDTAYRISKALGCTMEDLIDKNDI